MGGGTRGRQVHIACGEGGRAEQLRSDRGVLLRRGIVCRSVRSHPSPRPRACPSIVDRVGVGSADAIRGKHGRREGRRIGSLAVARAAGSAGSDPSTIANEKTIDSPARTIRTSPRCATVALGRGVKQVTMMNMLAIQTYMGSLFLPTRGTVLVQAAAHESASGW